MALLRTTLLAVLAGAEQEAPDYPLGKLRLPPMAEAADPFRLVDFRYAFSDDGRILSSFETRIRLGASVFVGGEVTGERRSLFFDTQRIELGLAEEGGRYAIEGSYRAPWFLLGVRASNDDDDWLVEGAGSVRLSNDLELLVSIAQDFDDSRFPPGTVEDFAISGELPPPAPRARELSSRGIGFLYQRMNSFEILGEASRSKRRTEASFDLEVERYRLAALVHRAPVTLDGSISLEKTSGRLPRTDGAAALGADVELGGHFLARAETLQRWEPGVLRFEDRYRVGLTFFGRRYRFSRSSEAAARLAALQEKANALGYNERRVYEIDGLRRFRERLGISGAGNELTEELDELYRAQVRDRNVPQLGFHFELADDAVRGVESRNYRLVLGVPWRLRWPFSRSEDSVEFLTAELNIREDDYSAGVRAVSYDLGIEVFLNREMSLGFLWERPGVAPEEIALEVSRPNRFTASYQYALGR